MGLWQCLNIRLLFIVDIVFICLMWLSCYFFILQIFFSIELGRVSRTQANILGYTYSFASLYTGPEDFSLSPCMYGSQEIWRKMKGEKVKTKNKWKKWRKLINRFKVKKCLYTTFTYQKKKAYYFKLISLF